MQIISQIPYPVTSAAEHMWCRLEWFITFNFVLDGYLTTDNDEVIWLFEILDFYITFHYLLKRRVRKYQLTKRLKQDVKPVSWWARCQFDKWKMRGIHLLSHSDICLCNLQFLQMTWCLFCWIWIIVNHHRVLIFGLSRH